MTELTDERLAELRTIAEAATPGDWCAGVDRDGTTVAIDCGDGYADVLHGGPVSCMDYCYGGVSTVEARDADWAHMVAFDPPTVLALLSELTEARKWLRGGIESRRSIKTGRDELQRRLDAVEARHTPVTVRYGDAADELACRACGTHYEYPVAWPCPTVKAARGEA